MINKKYYCPNCYHFSINKYSVNVEHNYDFGKINTALILQILMDGFNGILDIGSVEDHMMIKEKMLHGMVL